MHVYVWGGLAYKLACFHIIFFRQSNFGAVFSLWPNTFSNNSRHSNWSSIFSLYFIEIIFFKSEFLCTTHFYILSSLPTTPKLLPYTRSHVHTHTHMHIREHVNWVKQPEWNALKKINFIMKISRLQVPYGILDKVFKCLNGYFCGFWQNKKGRLSIIKRAWCLPT